MACSIWRALLVLVCMLPVAQAATLTVAVEDQDNRPFEYLDHQRQLTGFHIALERAVARRLHWQVRFVRVPWARAQALLAAGKVDAVSYMAANEARRRYARFLPDNILHVDHLTLYVRREDRQRIRYQMPLSDMMQRWRFGAQHGCDLGAPLDLAVQQGQHIDQEAMDGLQLYRKLQAHRIDVVVASVDGVQALQPLVPDIRQRVAALPGVVFESQPVYLAFAGNARGRAQARQFSEAYARWRRSGDYNRLVQQYHLEARIPARFNPQGDSAQ